MCVSIVIGIVDGGEAVAILLVSALVFVSGKAMAIAMAMQYRSGSQGKRMGS
jgi:hypothetical protein